MNKLQLPNITLCIIDCINVNRAIKVLERCKALADFGVIRLLTHIPTDYEHKIKIKPLNSLIAYSVFMLTNLHEFIDTPHVLIVQRDGWILNADSWNPDWLELDFIGPLFVQYDKMGSGGFSLRSKRLMQEAASKMPEWDGRQKSAEVIQETMGFYEDGVLCLSGKFDDFKFATLEQAADFAQGGNRNPEYFRERPFGFHRTFQQIDFKTGIVDSSDTTRDLHVSYDHEIDTLI